jgi:hypothetical protein
MRPPDTAVFELVVGSAPASSRSTRRPGLRGDERRGAAGKTSAGDDDVEAVVLGSRVGGVARRSRTGDGNAEVSIGHGDDPIV